jgi:hypothetical protein
MTNRFIYGLSLNDFNSDDTSSPSANPGSQQQRRSSYASVAASRARSARAPVSHLLNPSSPDESTDDAAMQRGHFYSSVRDYDRNLVARSSNSTGERPPSHNDAASSPVWLPKNTGLPWHSRAYDFFMSRDSHLPDELSSDGAHTRASKFLSPSYLRGTVYMDRLEEQHKRRLQALRDSHQHSHAQGRSSSSLPLHTSGVKLQQPPSHRGMTLDVVEKPPKFLLVEDDDDSIHVSPLPSRWNKDDKHAALDVVGDGYDVKYIGPKSSAEKDHEACAIRADHWMPGQCGVYYFEVTIISRKHAE